MYLCAVAVRHIHARLDGDEKLSKAAATVVSDPLGDGKFL